MCGLGFVVGLKRFVGGSNQIRLRLDAVSVVVNDPTAALAELVVNGPFDSLEFLGGQFRQRGLDFSNRAHGGKIAASESSVNGGRLSLISTNGLFGLIWIVLVETNIGANSPLRATVNLPCRGRQRAYSAPR
jgi:hypothetical protein